MDKLIAIPQGERDALGINTAFTGYGVIPRGDSARDCIIYIKMHILTV